MGKYKLFDMDGKEIEAGHIVAVRYVWNSYAGIVTPLRGLDVGGRFHVMDDKATYQILGHESESHNDYNPDIAKWIKEYMTERKPTECPIKIRVYDNCEPAKV
jgi:hypothetical protein